MREHNHTHARSVGPKPGYFDVLVTALEQVLVEKRLIEADEIQRQIDILDSRTTAFGAEVMARAWADLAFRARLLADRRGGCEKFGFSFYEDTGPIVVENTPKVDNVVVWTLCSCYPRPLLGPPAEWHEVKCRSRVGIEPRDLLAEFATIIPDEVEVRAIDSTSALCFLVLPLRPDGTDDDAQAERAAPVARYATIGVGQNTSREQCPMTILEDVLNTEAQPSRAVVKAEHELQPWEKRCHALADLLDRHEIINAEDKRRGVEALGAEFGKLGYYERLLTTFTLLLFQKGLLTPTKLVETMQKMERGWAVQSGQAWAPAEPYRLAVQR